MAQLTICLDEEFIKGILSAAFHENISVSEWVAGRLAGHIPEPRRNRIGRDRGAGAESELWAFPLPDPAWDD